MTRQEAESLLVTKALPLVRKLAWKYAAKLRLPFDDLVQVGTIAAWSRLPDYDPSRGELATFLVPRIKFSFIDHARYHGSAMGWSSRYRDLLPTRSLDSLTHDQEDSGEASEFEIEDRRQTESLDELDSFDRLIRDLHPREKRVLRLFYREGWSQLEIAKDMSYHPSRVSQILREALENLRWQWRAAA